MEQRQAWLEAHPVDVVWVNDLSRRIKARTDQLGVNAVNDEPDDLTKILGPVPPNPIGQDKWRQVAGHLEAYRERWHIQPGQLLDHRPERPEQTRHWRLLRETTIAYQRHAARQLDQTPSRKWQRDWYLEQEQARDRGIGPGLSR